MASTTWATARFHPIRVSPQRAEAEVWKPKEAEVLPAKVRRRRRLAAPSFRLPRLNVRPILYYPLAAIHSAVNCGFLAAIGLLLILFGLQFSHPAVWERTWIITHLRAWGDPVIAAVAAWASLQWPSTSISYLPLGLAVGGWIAKSTFDGFIFPVLRALRGNANSSGRVLRTVARCREAGIEVNADSERARGMLIRRLREAERGLKSSKRKRCAFLSIDVAGSTQMKEGERELAVTVTFRAYMEMLEEIFDQHSAWKQAWTPDGVMVCFLQLDLAIAAAQSILRRLRKFNHSENLLRTPIRVRCGLNEGEVAIFEDTSLEKFTHRTIDIAGHMQKHASPDTLWMSAEVCDRLSDRSGFRNLGMEVDGHEVYEWSPRLSGVDDTGAQLGYFEN
jgi:class 3 adenylate cyclase